MNQINSSRLLRGDRDALARAKRPNDIDALVSHTELIGQLVKLANLLGVHGLSRPFRARKRHTILAVSSVPRRQLRQNPISSWDVPRSLGVRGCLRSLCRGGRSAVEGNLK